MPTLTRINLDRVVARLNSFVVCPPPTMSMMTRFALCTSSSFFVCFVVVFSRRQRANSSSQQHSSLTSFLSLSLSLATTRQTESARVIKKECCYDAIKFLLFFPLSGKRKDFVFVTETLNYHFFDFVCFYYTHARQKINFKTLFVARRRRRRRRRRTTRSRRPR